MYKIISFKCIFLLGICFLFLFCFPISVSGYSKVDNFDRYQSVFSQYDGYSSDFINCLDNAQKNDVYSQLLNFLNNNEYCFYIYPGNLNGLDVMGPGVFSPPSSSLLNVCFYKKNVSFTIDSTGNISYLGMYMAQEDCLMFLDAFDDCVTFTFNGNILSRSDRVYPVYIPTCLYLYISPIFSSYLQQTNTTSVIEDTSAATQNTIIESAQETQNVITNSTVSDESMAVNTDDFEVQDEQGVDNFFTNFLENMKNTFSGVDTSVSVINIPLPFVEGTIELRSDVISSVVSGTYFATLIELFWYFVFGTYYIIFVKRMLDYLSTGEIAKSGVTGFIKYLDNQNQVIKTYMM